MKIPEYDNLVDNIFPKVTETLLNLGYTCTFGDLVSYSKVDKTFTFVRNESVGLFGGHRIWQKATNIMTVDDLLKDKSILNDMLFIVLEQILGGVLNEKIITTRSGNRILIHLFNVVAKQSPSQSRSSFLKVVCINTTLVRILCILGVTEFFSKLDAEQWEDYLSEK